MELVFWRDFSIRRTSLTGANQLPVAQVAAPAWSRHGRTRTLKSDGDGQETGSATGVAAVGDDG